MTTARIEDIEARYRLLVEYSNDLIIIFNREGLCLFISPACRTMMGYDPEALVGRFVYEFVHSEDVDLLRQCHRDILETAKAQSIRCRVLHRNGTYLWTETSARLVPGSGADLGNEVVAICRDVSDQVRSEGDLRKALEYCKQLIETANVMIVGLDSTGCVELFNETAERITGYQREEVAGRNWFETLVPKERYPEVRQTFEGLQAGDLRQKSVFANPILTNSGEERFINWQNSRLQRDGRFEGTISFGVDVTERILAENALRESEHQWRTLVEQSCDPIYVMQLNPLQLLLVNPAWERLLGYSSAEATSPGFDYVSIVAPDSRPLILDRAAKREKALPLTPIYEFRARARDGRILELEASVTQIMWHGKPALQGMYRDITAHKEAERKLRLSDQILHRVGALVVAADSTGRITYVGPSVKEILGHEPAELLGEGWWNLTHSEPETRGRRRERVAGIARGEVPVPKAPYEQLMRQRDGNSRWILWHDTVGSDGQVIGVGQDITELKRAEEQLHKVMRAVEQSPISVAITDTQGRIQYVNPKLIEITGFSVEEVVGNTTQILESGDMPREEYRALWETIRSGREWTGELHSKRKNGELFWEHATIAPIKNAQGEITHFVAIKEDITLRKNLEQQLRQAQKMEAVGRLAGGIAHDFNNLLTAINGYSELILNSLEDADPLRKDIGEIKKAGDRAASLTRQLLAFSHKQVLRPRVLDLNAVLADIDELIRRLTREDIELVTSLQPDLGCVKADPGQIEQVILNLAINARDAMPHGGKLVIRTANVRADKIDTHEHPGMRPGPYVLLAMSDTGCGMDAETLAQIFDPFFTTKDVGKGTGLGLSTAYGIIKQSGGYIYAASEPGRGATFEVYLPEVDRAVEADAAGAQEAPKTDGQETILLVEDDDAVRSLSAKILRRCGYTVLEAASGKSALSIVKRHHGTIQLLITDIVMPRMGGNELVQQLVPLRPEMKVIYLSGYTDDAVVLRRLQETSAAFLLKPFSPSALARKVVEVLHQA